MPSDIEIVECKTKAERKQFISFQWEVYKGDAHWVPPLVSEREAFWDRAKNPFYEHSDATMFMALRGGRIAGTIAAIHNKRHLQFHPDGAGFFGGFEVMRDYDVAAALFDTAKSWLRARGLTTLRGPATMSLNDESGLLIEGFDEEPAVLMSYNPRYYQDFIERYGFVKAMDLWSWWAPTALAMKNLDGRMGRIAAASLKRGKFTIRKANLSKLEEEVQVLKKIYTSEEGAWRDNWGHVPMTDHEIDHLVRGLKQFADPDFLLIAEKEGQPVGISVSLPNVNTPLRLAYPSPRTPEPITLAKFLWYRRKHVDSIRFALLGVLPEHRMSGLDSALILETMRTVDKKGLVGGDLGWILETNDAMNRIIALGAERVYRKYRMYDAQI